MHVYIHICSTYIHLHVLFFGVALERHFAVFKKCCAPQKTLPQNDAAPRPNEAMKTKSGTPYYAGRTQQG